MILEYSLLGSLALILTSFLILQAENYAYVENVDPAQENGSVILYLWSVSGFRKGIINKNSMATWLSRLLGHSLVCFECIGYRV